MGTFYFFAALKLGGVKMSKKEKIFMFLSSLFVVLIVLSNITASKITALGNFFVPAAVVFYAITFAITDTISEVWGRERCKHVINVGFIISVAAALLLKAAISLPPAPFYGDQQAYSLILGGSLRITIAGLAAYLISQHHDMWAFEFWKKQTNGKHLWLRNNASTLVSQFIDTAVFITLAFYGTGMPLLNLIVTQYFVKAVIALIDTPIVYMLVDLVSKTEKKVESLA
jgi:queuosine precursor transporter